MDINRFYIMSYEFTKTYSMMIKTQLCKYWYILIFWESSNLFSSILNLPHIHTCVEARILNFTLTFRSLMIILNDELKQGFQILKKSSKLSTCHFLNSWNRPFWITKYSDTIFYENILISVSIQITNYVF